MEQSLLMELPNSCARYGKVSIFGKWYRDFPVISVGIEKIGYTKGTCVGYNIATHLHNSFVLTD